MSEAVASTNTCSMGACAAADSYACSKNMHTTVHYCGKRHGAPVLYRVGSRSMH